MTQRSKETYIDDKKKISINPVLIINCYVTGNAYKRITSSITHMCAFPVTYRCIEQNDYRDLAELECQNKRR